jgi:hypothetical protein
MLSYTEVKPGDILEYKGFVWHWFTNIEENSKLLTIGEKYKVKSVEVASSWTCIKLEGFPCEKHGDKWFCLSMFKRPDNLELVKCPDCNGYGDLISPETGKYDCRTCEGKGYSWKQKNKIIE